MKIYLKQIIILTSLTLVLGVLLGWLFFGGSKENAPEGNVLKGEASHEHLHTTEKGSETIWTCSMHPQIRQGEPGDCPICGMDLIPLENEDGEALDPMAVSMSPTAMQLASVSTALVGSMDPVKSVRLNGKVEADERLIFSQSSHIPGRIEKLMVNFTGEFVRKGQAIAYVYSPELVTAQEELFEAQKIKETQPQLFKAAKEKLKNWKLTDSQVEQILQTGSPKEEFAVLADVSGYVTQKKVNLGDYIRKGEAIYQIADLSKVWVLFDVYEMDMPWVKKGDQVNFTIPSLPGETFKGTISYLDPVIDPKTRVARARVEASNRDLKLKPEMFASGTVEAKLPKKSNALVVPKTAVMWTGTRSVAYVKSTSGKGVNFVMREVDLGPALGDSYIVESGLQEGDEIATNGTFSIDAAAQLAGKPSMMNPEGGPAMTGHNHGGMEMPSAPKQSGKKDIKSITISQEAKEALQPLYQEYLTMKDALTADQLTNAQEAASNMQAALSRINMSLFTGEAHNVWMQHSSELEKAIQHVAHFKTVEEVRKAFQQASDHMVALTGTFHPYNETLYVQHCPMASENKGADWLSLEKEVRNPYFGESMIGCGEVKATYQ